MKDKDFMVTLIDGTVIDLRNQNMGNGNEKVEKYLQTIRRNENDNGKD